MIERKDRVVAFRCRSSISPKTEDHNHSGARRGLPETRRSMSLPAMSLPRDPRDTGRAFLPPEYGRVMSYCSDCSSVPTGAGWSSARVAYEDSRGGSQPFATVRVSVVGFSPTARARIGRPPLSRRADRHVGVVMLPWPAPGREDLETFLESRKTVEPSSTAGEVRTERVTAQPFPSAVR
jgi:hypothetical protein